MKKIKLFILFFVPALCFAQGSGVDSLRFGASSGGSVWIAMPSSSTTNYRLLLPSSLGVSNSQILYVNGTSGQISALNPGNNGELLRISSGSLNWLSPDTLFAASGWALRGNAGTNPNLNFIGTTDAQPLRFATNGIERLRILSGGNIGIGTSTPTQLLHLSTGHLFLDTVSSGSAAELRMANPAGTFFSSFKSGAQTANLSYTWPTAAPSSGQVLSSDASGVLSWSTALTGSTGWSLSGNATATAWNGSSGSFLGTTSAQALSIATTNATAQDIKFYTGSNGATERMRISSTGNVGIGTSGAPGYNLEVNGATIYMHSGATPYFYAAGGGNVGIGQSSSPASTLSVGGNATIGYNLAAPSNGMIVQGNVGIGTSSPSTTLHVNGSARVSGGNILIDTSAASTAGKLQFMNPARTFQSTFAAGAQSATINYTLPTALPTNNGVLQTTNAGLMSWTDLGAGNSLVTTAGGVATRVAFWSGTNTLSSNTNLYWDNTNSRLGIGTNTPSQSLSTTGNIDLSSASAKITGSGGNLTIEQTGDTYGTTRLHLQNRSGVNGAMFEQAGSVDLVDFVFKGLANQRNIRYENRTGFGFTAIPEFQIGTGGSPNLVVSDNLAAFRNGNVGIGTVSPNAPLQFANTVANRKITLYESTNNDHEFYGFGINSSILRYQVSSSSANHIFYSGASSSTSNELMRITGASNVSIGGVSPVSRLHIDGGTGASSIISLTNNGSSGVSASDGFAVGLQTDLSAILFNRESAALLLGTSNTERMQISSSGNVGIGTSSPTTGLHYVNSNSILSSSAIQTQNVSNYLLLGNLNNASYELRIQEPNGSGSNYSALKSTVQSYDMTYTLPQTVPSANQVLEATTITGSSGAGYNVSLSWVNPTGGGGASGVTGTGQPGEVAFWSTTSQITSDARLYWDDGLLRLGIGTNTPGEKVDVQGNLLISNGNSLPNELRIAEPFYTTGNQSYTAFTTQAQSTNLVYRLPGVIPTASSFGNNHFAFTTEDLADTMALTWQTFWSPQGNAGTNPTSAFLGTTDNQALAFRTNNTEKVRIGTDGQVSMRNGNGSGSFTYNQFIAGWQGVSDYQYSHAIKTRHNGGAVTDNAWDFYVWSQGTDASSSVGTKHALTIEGASGTANLGIGGVYAPHANIHLPALTSNRKLIAFETANNDHQFYGLGVNTSVFRYQVDATSSSHAFYAGTSSSTSTELMRIQGNGLVGIATSAPSTALHVYGSSDVVLATAASGLITSGISTGLNIAIDNNEIMARNNGVKSGLYMQAEGGDFSIHNLMAGTEFIVKDNGYVGVGAPNPSTKLHVGGGHVLIDTSAASTAGQLQFMNPARTFASSFRAGAQTAAINYVLPTTAPSASQYLRSDASGNLSWSSLSTTVPISSLSAATATNTINNAAFQQTWQWNSLGGSPALNLSSTSTAAASNAQALLKLDLSGANSTASQTTYALQANNTHSGSTSTNVAAYFNASGATNNYGVVVASGYTGLGTTTPTTTLHVNGSERLSGGNMLLDTSASGTSAQLQFMNPARTFQTTFQAGAQLTNINYTLPTAAPSAGQFLQSDASGNLSWSNSSSSQVISSLTAATATNTINNAAFNQTWQWNSLANSSALTLSANTTAAASNTQTLLNVALSGINSNPGQTTYGLQVSNSHTGTSSTNVGALFSASGASTNYGLLVSSGSVGIGTIAPSATLHVSGSTRLSGGNILIDTASAGSSAQLQFMNPARTFSSSFQAGAQTANINYTLPTSAPSANAQVLSSTTSGTMSWMDLSTSVAGVQFKAKTVDEAITNTNTVQSDDDLLYSQPANQTWEYEFVLHVTTNSATNGGYQYTVTAPAGATVFFGTSAYTTATAESVITSSGLTHSVASLSNGTPNVVKLKGYVTTAATAGSVNLQWAQATMNANEARVKTGSYLKATRIQ